MTASTSAAHTSLARMLIDEHPDDALPLLETAAPGELAEVLGRQSRRRAAILLGGLTAETAAQALVRIPAETVARILPEVDPGRGAALLARLSPENREACLDRMDPALAKELRSLMSYPADTAGGLMDPRVITFPPEATARDAMQKLRRVRRRRIQDVFLVDPAGRLIGAVSLQDLALAAADKTLRSLMRAEPPRVDATSSREAVIEILQLHGSESLPVVDFEGRLVGVLRQEELIRTAHQDAAAGAVKMTGAGQDERALSSPFFALRKRLPWLQINLLTAFLAASVVGLFEGTIAKFTALAVLLPVVAGQSGNTGAQALAVTMRGLALREIRIRHWPRVTTKEVLAGAMNGVAVALTTSLAVLLWSRSPGLALVIGVSMVISMTAAGLAGATIPIVLSALRQDPAQASSIILTTVTDIVGFFSFLGIATALSAFL